MLENLSIKLHLALLTLAGAFATRFRRVSTARRGAEFIEVALYAAIILMIAFAFRGALKGAFDNLLTQITTRLGQTQ